MSSSIRAVTAIKRGPLGPAQEVAAGPPALARLAAFLQHGPGAVPGQGAVDVQPDMVQSLGADPLDRVTPDLGERPAHLLSGFFRL